MNRFLGSQNVILEPGRYYKYLPFAFTEQGVAMLSSVLNGERAIEVNLAIDILGALKEKRQIIVCTHNPNIVVSGDAEQVIVLNAISDRKAKVEKHGSIDNEDIVQSVIDIMEGGRDAFRVRQHRYGMDLPSAVAAGGVE